ncbi:MAG: hypothetical protein KC646_06380 [Candidatus Cloacimonetes bacterium]|nr:hypothetical protein [Candidatus Cloacimonadota bacterium]
MSKLLYIIFYTLFLVFMQGELTISYAVCTKAEGSSGACDPQDPVDPDCALTKVAVGTAITNTEDETPEGGRTSIDQYGIDYRHDGGPEVDYNVKVTGLSGTDIGSSESQRVCEGKLIAFFTESGEKQVRIEVFQVQRGVTQTSSNAFKVVYDVTPPELRVNQVFIGSGTDGGPLVYSSGTTYFTSDEVTITATVVDKAPAQQIDKLGMQVVAGLPGTQAFQTSPNKDGKFEFPLGLSGAQEGTFTIEVAGVDSDSATFGDGSAANFSESQSIRVVLDKTAPVLLKVEIITNPSKPDQETKEAPGVFIPSGEFRVRATFSEDLATPPTLLVGQVGLGVGEAAEPYPVGFDSALFQSSKNIVEYTVTPLVGDQNIGPIDFTFQENGTDKAGNQVDPNSGIFTGGTGMVISRAAILDIVPPDINRLGTNNAGEVQSIPANNEKIAKGSFPERITVIVRDYDLPERLGEESGGDLASTASASGVDFNKISSGTDTDASSIKIDVTDPNAKVIPGTLVTQPPNGLQLILPDPITFYSEFNGVPPEGVYTVRVSLVDQVGNIGVETFFFTMDNTNIRGETIQVALFPEPDGTGGVEQPNPFLTNPINDNILPDSPDLITDLSTLNTINALDEFKVCSADPTFNLTRSTFTLKARLNGPDTVGRTMVVTGSPNINDAENTCRVQGATTIRVDKDQRSIFPNLNFDFPNPGGVGANVPEGDVDPRFGQFDGPYFVEVIAVDEAGNFSDPIRKEFILDTTAPHTESTFPINNGKVGGALRHVSAVVIDPHPPRLHVFDEEGHINYGSGISKDHTGIKLFLENGYRQPLNGDIFTSENQLRGALRFVHNPNSSDPDLPSYNPNDDSYKVLLEFVNKQSTPVELPKDGSADGVYKIEVIPADNAGNTLTDALAGTTGYQIPSSNPDSVLELRQNWFFLYDSIAPTLKVDAIGGKSFVDEIRVNGHNFGLTGKIQDLSAKTDDPTKGGSGIDRVEYSIVYKTTDGAMVASQIVNGKEKKNPIIDGAKAILANYGSPSNDPTLSSTKPLDPTSYPDLVMEELAWTINSSLPDVTELIGPGEVADGKAANYWLEISAYDQSGNVTKREIKLIVNFGAIPAPEIVSPQLNQYFQKSVINFQFRQIEQANDYILTVTHPDTSVTTKAIGIGNPTEDVLAIEIFPKEGEYKWKVAARDSVGNVGTESLQQRFTIDRHAPALSLTNWTDLSPQSQGKLTRGSFKLSLLFNEALKEFPKVHYIPFNGASIPPQVIATSNTDGSLWEGIATVPLTATATWDGIATVEITGAKDYAGNIIRKDRSVTFEIDTGPSYEVKMFENPVRHEEIILVVKSSEQLLGNLNIIEPTGVEFLSNEILKIPGSLMSYQTSFKLRDSALDEASIRIAGSDVNGNASSRTVRFPLVKAGPTQSSLLRSTSMLVNIPTNAVRTNRSVALLPPNEMTTQSNSQDELSKVQELGLLSPMNLQFVTPSYGKIMINRPLQDQEALFIQNSSTREYVPVTYLNGELLFKVNSGGNFAIYKDQKPPMISLEDDEDEDLLLSGSNPKFVFNIADLGVGVRDVQVSLGAKQMSISDLGDGSYEASYSGHLPRGQHSVSIVSNDKVGNKSILKATASVSGPIRLSAQVYPNPVRDVLKVRYQLSRNARNLSFKIYDSAGDRVFVSSLNTDMTITAVAGVNEYQWELENSRGLEVANGVYILQIDAEDSQGYRDRVRIKVAVLR